MSQVTTCPCCNSKVRVTDEGELEVVSMTKPEPGERWRPASHLRRRDPVPATEIEVKRNRDARDAFAVIDRVAGEAGFSLSELRSSKRTPRLVRARWLAAAARAETEASLPQIGHILNCHHSTVLHGLRQLEVAATSAPTHEPERTTHV